MTLKENIATLAAQEGKTELQIITQLQGACVKQGNMPLLDALCELKRGFIEALAA